MPRTLKSVLTDTAQSEELAYEFRRLAGGWKTPEMVAGNGAVDRTGTTDVTAKLIAWIEDLRATGDPGFLPRGSYRTSAEVYADLTSGGSVFIQGVPRGSYIRPVSGGGHHGIRFKGQGFSQRRGFVSGITVLPIATSITQDFTAGIVFDTMPMMAASDLSVSRRDIGIDIKGNCYNLSLQNYYVPRDAAPLVGLNLREGPQSGSDLFFYNLSLSGCFRHSAVIQGGGGGYRFFGGQWGTTNNTGSANDSRGLIQMAYDYDAAAAAGGLATCLFSGITFEGARDVWCIRGHGEMHATFQTCSWYMAAPDHKTIGLAKLTNAGRSKVQFYGCNIGGGYQAADLAGMSVAEGVASGHKVFTNDEFYVSPQGVHTAGSGTVSSYMGPAAYDGGFCTFRGYPIINGRHCRPMANNPTQWETSADGNTWVPMEALAVSA